MSHHFKLWSLNLELPCEKNKTKQKIVYIRRRLMMNVIPQPVTPDFICPTGASLSLFVSLSWSRVKGRRVLSFDCVRMSFLFEGRWIGRGLSAQTILPSVQRRHRFPSLKPDYYLFIDLFVSRPNAQQMMVLKKKKNAPSCSKQLLRQPKSGSESERVDVDSGVGQE